MRCITSSRIVLLMVTLFWALWDEFWGQRPWKAYQEVWKHRYIAFLSTATSKSPAVPRPGGEESRLPATRPGRPGRRRSGAAPQRRTAEADHQSQRQILAVQSVFTDRAPTSTPSPTRSRPIPAPPGKRASRRISTSIRRRMRPSSSLTATKSNTTSSSSKKHITPSRTSAPR